MICSSPSMERTEQAFIENSMRSLPSELHKRKTVSGLWLVTGPPGSMGKVRALGLTEVEPDYRYPLLNGEPVPPRPNDPYFGNQWSLDSTQGPPYDADINAPEAWSLFTPPKMPGDPNAIIGIIDNGLTLRDDLAPNLWVNDIERWGVDGCDDDGNGYIDDVNGIDAQTETGLQERDLIKNTDQRHGTQVASIIGARGNNGRMIAGVSWTVRLLPCRFHETLHELVTCLRYFVALKRAKQNVVAINLSLGGPCSCCVEKELRNLRELGVLVVAAAGNDGQSNDYLGSKCPTFPASSPISNVISVAASDPSEELAEGTQNGILAKSNYGSRSVHLSAPGYRIRSIATRDSTSTARLELTSAATPHVTGVIPLLKGQDRHRDWRALRNLIIAGGTPNLPGLSEVTISGRRLRAADRCKSSSPACTGSMTCRNQFVRRRLVPIEGEVSRKPGDTVFLKALSINCAKPIPVRVKALDITDPTAPVTVRAPRLNDNGRAPDEVKGDGEYTAEWVVPKTAGQKKYQLRFWSDNPDQKLVDREALTVTVTQ